MKVGWLELGAHRYIKRGVVNIKSKINTTKTQPVWSIGTYTPSYNDSCQNKQTKTIGGE